MVAYGTNSAVQILAYGAANSDEDVRSSQARSTSTAIINATLMIIDDLSAPSNTINQACNLISAAIITTPPEALATNAFWIQGMLLLDLEKGGESVDVDWAYSYFIGRE